MDYKYLMELDKNWLIKLSSIDESLICAEIKFIKELCTLADIADLDRRIVLRAALLTIDELWNEMIMAV